MGNIKCGLIAALLLLTTSALACLNYYVVNERGEENIFDDYKPFSVYINPKNDLQSLKAYENWIKEGKGAEQYRYICNYAAYLIKLGWNNKALPILKKLYVSHPNEYEVNGNLAVAFELNGQPDSALHYLDRALSINPAAHHNSEWFHRRLLEAWIDHKKYGSDIQKMNILKIDTSSSFRIGNQISTQLHERIPLTGAPNALLSKAIEESADFFKRVVSIDWSARLYGLAIAYAEDSITLSRLETKLYNTRNEVVSLSLKNPRGLKDLKDDTRRILVRKDWRKVLQKEIDTRRKYKPHYESKLVVLEL